MGNLVSTFFDEENEEQHIQEQIEPPFLEQVPIHKKRSRKNKTARKRKLSEKNTMNNYSNYNY
jgi:hypothetical protein